MTSKADKGIRLDKYLASVSDYSRSQVKRLLKAGRVRLADEIVNDPSQLVPLDAELYLDDEPLRQAGARYFMLNKPVGHVCANKDRLHLTVFDLIDEDNADKLFVAGRLDIDTTGLVLITDDGQWAHAVTSPQKKCWKTYWVECELQLNEEMLQRLSEGVFLDEEKHRCRPAQVEQIDDFTLRLRITEGKFHQVKRMLRAVGNQVDTLHREAIGDIHLDDLEEGEYRELSEAEVASVLASNSRPAGSTSESTTPGASG